MRGLQRDRVEELVARDRRDRRDCAEVRDHVIREFYNLVMARQYADAGGMSWAADAAAKDPAARRGAARDRDHRAPGPRDAVQLPAEDREREPGHVLAGGAPADHRAGAVAPAVRYGHGNSRPPCRPSGRSRSSRASPTWTRPARTSSRRSSAGWRSAWPGLVSRALRARRRRAGGGRDPQHGRPADREGHPRGPGGGRTRSWSRRSAG